MGNKIIRVGISLLSPFVVKNQYGYSGFEIDLWEEIASRLNIKYEYIKTPFHDLINNLKEKKYDLAFSGITINNERDEHFDFTTSYLNSGLSILSRKQNKIKGARVIKNNLLKELGKIVLFFTLFIFSLSNFVWFSQKNYGTIANNYYSGIIESIQYIYYSIINLSFQDITPYQKKDQIFLALIILVTFIITVIYIIKMMILLFRKEEIFDPQIIDDLRGKRVATEKDSTSEKLLKSENIKTISYPKIETAYKKLHNGLVDAVLYDTLPILHFIKDKSDFKISPQIAENQEYAMAINPQSGMRGEIDTEILKMKEDGFFNFLYEKWFGNNQIIQK